jgi:hypothetical protein
MNQNYQMKNIMNSFSSTSNFSFNSNSISSTFNSSNTSQINNKIEQNYNKSISTSIGNSVQLDSKTNKISDIMRGKNK